MGFLFAVESKSNRTVSIDKGQWQQVQKLATIPEDGWTVWLRGFGKVKLLRTYLKNQARHYVVYLPDTEKLTHFGRDDFRQQHDHHWKIEQYHRAINQVCHIEHFQVRGKRPIFNHVFAALGSYIDLQVLQVADVIANIYHLR